MYTMRLPSMQNYQIRAPCPRSMLCLMRALPSSINAATAQLTIKIGSDSDELMQAARLRAEAYYEVRIYIFHILSVAIPTPACFLLF
jgi:hypothetical protein